MNLKTSYSKNGDALVKQEIAINYERRIPTASENISAEIKNDPLISPESKTFYLKTDGQTRLNPYKVQCLGINNLWLNVDTKILNF
jgi:hypothetical protein